MSKRKRTDETRDLIYTIYKRFGLDTPFVASEIYDRPIKPSLMAGASNGGWVESVGIRNRAKIWKLTETGRKYARNSSGDWT